jgi:ketosteroid isomerase-like protein
MSRADQLLKRLYDHFNGRDIDAALAAMHPDVVWANGLNGGHVHGHDGVRDYWKKQWAAMDSRATPIDFAINADGSVEVQVHLTARDREGKVLFDTNAVHVFRLDDGLIRRFDIRH